MLFDFSNRDSLIDSSGMRRPVEMLVETPDTVRREPGFLNFNDRSVVRSKTRAVKIHQSCCWTNELTVEVWIEPADDQQKGPARILSFSRNGSQRNFTLGQDGNCYDFRLRTTRTSGNGIPSLSTRPGTATKRLTHVVYTRSRNGRAKIFLDGQLAAEAVVPGDFSNWDINFRLSAGNELSGDRPWKGKMYLAAIYNRALTSREVVGNFRAGNQATTPELSTVAGSDQDRFRDSVAPILARHCLECHDEASQKGGLDLSRRVAAFRGGESGQVIKPGQVGSSTLWKSVQSKEMPLDRSPLGDSELQALRKWIEEGAAWTVEKIDPAVFLRSRQVDDRLIRRLTRDEYISSVNSAVGIDISQQARKWLPKDLRADGFDNTAYNLNVDLKHVEVYSRLAEVIVQQVDVEKLSSRFVSKQDLGDSSQDELISKMGAWVLRGPLDAEERFAYLDLGRTVRDSGGDFKELVKVLLEVMLQSPRFLYHVERQKGDGNWWPVDVHTLANRVSFVIWGSPPDQELFELAVSGQLEDPIVLARQVDRLLRDVRAESRSLQFVSQWLNLDRLDNLKPDPKKYPDWNPRLAADMKAETLAVWREVVWSRGRPVTDIFDADFTWVTPELARHYGMKGFSREGLPSPFRVRLEGAVERRGILTHGSVLTVGGDEASMVSRGLFLLNDVLRGVVKDPPPCVDTTPVATRAGLTQRAIAMARIADRNCGGCHARFEPLAFGLERFDGLGRFRPTDHHGNELRQDGKLRFPVGKGPTPFKSSIEFARLIAGNERTAETLAWKLTQFCIGRPLGPADNDRISGIYREAKGAGGTYPQLIRAILASDLIRKSRTVPYPKQP
ncbi:MAG: DUF1592 domain-containing protein [Planctomycetota bacterium]|nr:DUF1592 domain-containing protein [Planctomycetota bacterium]